MNRRGFLSGVSISALMMQPALARFPRGGTGASGGGGGGGGGGGALAPAMYPTTNIVGGDYVPVAVRFTGTAPSSIVSATWSGGGGSGTILSSSFVVTGNVANFMVSTPSPGSTTSYDLAVITNLGTGTTFTGMSVLVPHVDMASGIYGPTDAYWGHDQPTGNSFFPSIPIAAYVTRGLPGVLTASITDTVASSGDAAWFTLSSKSAGRWGGFSTAHNLCPTYNLYARGPDQQTTYAIDVNITNGITTRSISVTIHRLATETVAVFAWDNVWGGSYYANYYNNQIILDSTQPAEGGSTSVPVVQIGVQAGGISFTPDAGGIFSWDGSNFGLVSLDQSHLTSYGHHTCQIQATSGPGPVQTLDFWILKRRPPVAEWRPNGSIYSSTPTTTGFFESNRIGTLKAYSDEHGIIQTSSFFRYQVISDSSGALQVWNNGEVYLSSSVSEGTIDAVIDITALSGTPLRVHLSLPVLAGTTLASSNISATISSSLTNFVPYANPLRNSSTSFPYGTPVPVGTFTISGFSNPIDWSNVQTSMPLGATFDNAQIANGGDMRPPSQNYQIPRYIVAGSGTSGTITATNLSAKNKHTPQIDVLRLQFTDGLGTYCTKDISIPVAWHVATTTVLTVGPGGDFETPHIMQQAMWTDFNANGAASVYAGCEIRPLPGCPVDFTNGFSYGPGGGGSHFSGGWWPYPVSIAGPTATQWSGNATISSTTMTINSTSSGAIAAGDYIASGVGSSKVQIQSGSGSTWTVHVGPDQVSATLSVGPTAMTTKKPRFLFDFAHGIPGGSGQGGIMRAGYDLDVRNIEFKDCTGAFDGGGNYTSWNANAAGIYMVADKTGNLHAEDCYFHGNDVGILNGGPGVHVTVLNCMFYKNGNGNGSQHNIYTDQIAYLEFIGNQSSDTFLGHEFKTRAMQAIITDNVFAQGPNGQGSCPINYTINGNMQFLRNIVTKTPNTNVSGNSLFHQLLDEVAGPSESTSDNVGQCWPYQNSLIDSCKYYNVVPRDTAPFQNIQIFSVFGTFITINHGFTTGFWGDPYRNTLTDTTVTNTGFGNVDLSDEYAIAIVGGEPPIYDSSNYVLTNFPATAVRIVDPVTGTPPFRLPQQGPYGQWFGGSSHRTSTIGSSPGTYYMSLTVPSGSPSGTNVKGGALTAYDANFAVMASPVYTFNNDYTTDNALFSITTVGSGVQLKTASTLADGLYTVTLQCVGTGWHFLAQSNTTFTSITSFRVIVGIYD